jgi:hypothetical protein
VRVVIYLHPWCEAMALAPLLWRISPDFPKT